VSEPRARSDAVAALSGATRTPLRATPRGWRSPMPALPRGPTSSSPVTITCGLWCCRGNAADRTPPCSSGAAMAHRLGRPHQCPQAPPRPRSLPLSRPARRGALGRIRVDREQSACPGPGQPTTDMNLPAEWTCSGAEAKERRTGRTHEGQTLALPSFCFVTRDSAPRSACPEGSRVQWEAVPPG
jgi:hypothetical protein